MSSCIRRDERRSLMAKNTSHANPFLAIPSLAAQEHLPCVQDSQFNTHRACKRGHTLLPSSLRHFSVQRRIARICLTYLTCMYRLEAVSRRPSLLLLAAPRERAGETGDRRGSVCRTSSS